MASRQSRTGAKAAAQKPRPASAPPDNAPEAGELLSPDELARALRAMATELERDPALARRVAGAMRAPGDVAPPQTPQPVDASDADDPSAQPVRRKGRSFQPKLVTGVAPALGLGAPDPFALGERLGEDGLRAALAELRLGTLRAIVREYRLDPQGRLAGQNDDAKYRALILRATKRGKQA